MNKKKLSTLFIVQAAMIAAIYVVLTVFISAFGLASGAIQVRISEALCILPVFTPAAVPGLFVGCLIANIIVPGAGLADIVFGSLATLIGIQLPASKEGLSRDPAPGDRQRHHHSSGLKICRRPGRCFLVFSLNRRRGRADLGLPAGLAFKSPSLEISQYYL